MEHGLTVSKTNMSTNLYLCVVGEKRGEERRENRGKEREENEEKRKEREEGEERMEKDPARGEGKMEEKISL